MQSSQKELFYLQHLQNFYFWKHNNYCICLFLNHFIKNQSFVWGIIIIISIYFLLNGNLFHLYIVNETINGTEYLSINNPNHAELFNFILMPWMQIGIYSRVIFYNINVNWWGYSQAGVYSIFLWTPYFFILFFVSLPLLDNKLRTME